MGDNDVFIAQARKASCDMDSRGCEDFCDIFLGQVNIRAAPLGAVLGKKVQQITQLDEGAVVFLMRALVQQKIDVGCVPVRKTCGASPPW